MATFTNVRPSLPQRSLYALEARRRSLLTVEDAAERLRAIAPREPELAERPRSTPTKIRLG